MVHCKVPAIIGLPLVSLLAVSFLTVSAAPVTTTTALQLREEGTMAEYFDQHQLVKRINVALFTVILTSFGKVTETACAADVEPVSKAIICGIAVVGIVSTLIYGAYRALGTDRMLKERMALDVRAPSQIINLVPRIPGKSHTDALYQQYTGVPILIGFNDCFGPGCFKAHYQNHVSKEGRILHHISVHPRHNSTTLARRQDEQQSGDSDGLYGDYLYHNENTGTEEGLANAEDQTTFEDDLENDVNNDEWSNTGIHCFNIFDSDAGILASAGYFSLNNDTPYQDPDNEDSYISQCESKGTTG